jgi:2-dehydro-3-deoxyphosphogalactonate aldolase
LIPVGGVGAQTMADYVAKGAAGFGLGSSLYKPDLEIAEIERRARALIDAWIRARGA